MNESTVLSSKPISSTLSRKQALLVCANAITAPVSALPGQLFGVQPLCVVLVSIAFIHMCTGLKYIVFHMLVNSHIFLPDFFYKLQATSSPPSLSPERLIFPACISECLPQTFLTAHLSTVECQYLGGPFANSGSLQSLGGQFSARLLTCGENTDLLQGNRQHSKSYKGCHWEQFF